MTRAKDISKIVTDADLSGTLDVTGTVTAGAVAVDGTNVVVADLDTTNSNADITLDNVSYGVRLRTTSAGGFSIMPADTTYFNVAGNGDISFYEDTGTTPKMIWDASAESLGIGTSPSHELHIAGAGDTRGLITSGGSGDAVFMFENASGNTWGHGLDVSSGNYAIAYNASGDPSLTADGLINIDTSGNLTLSGLLAKASMPVGSVLQVLQGVKTDTFVSSATVDDQDVTGLTVSITPRSTSSKILVICNLGIAAENAQGGATKLKRTIGGTSTQLSLADTAGSRSRGSFAGSAYRGSDTPGSHLLQQRSQHLTYLDSPSTTSAITYGVQVSSISVGTYINRSGTDNNAKDTYRGVSYITVMEIQG